MGPITTTTTTSNLVAVGRFPYRLSQAVLLQSNKCNKTTDSIVSQHTSIRTVYRQLEDGNGGMTYSGVGGADFRPPRVWKLTIPYALSRLEDDDSDDSAGLRARCQHTTVTTTN